MEEKRFSIDINTLFDNRSETIALIYDEHGGINGKIVTDEGEIVKVNERHIYEQVEFFNDLKSLEKRKDVLARITNRRYTNFRIINK